MGAHPTAGRGGRPHHEQDHDHGDHQQEQRSHRAHLLVSPPLYDRGDTRQCECGAPPRSLAPSRTECPIDAVDRQLVDLLRANGRASYAELARQVGLSAPAVHERVGKLETAGVITGYRAVVDPAALGLDVTALVGVIESDSVDDTGVEAALRAMPEVEDCWRVAGSEGYVLKVRVTDIPALEAAINALNRIEGVARTRTTVVLSTKWEGRHD
ncbi:Lrp/AsnC family transcriptional regulator [Geodermatophilus sp. FMUSA9-8]|uniref:Lrp/AsnC family transcriptional regulator n=1 Tax=Geodermatophilus sp. FMUSA9-8 TaxID=3120155 RepID=UPI00300937BD